MRWTPRAKTQKVAGRIIKVPQRSDTTRYGSDWGELNVYNQRQFGRSALYNSRKEAMDMKKAAHGLYPNASKIIVKKVTGGWRVYIKYWG